VVLVEIKGMVGVRKAIGTLDLGMTQTKRNLAVGILTGVLGILSLEIKIRTWT